MARQSLEEMEREYMHEVRARITSQERMNRSIHVGAHEAAGRHCAEHGQHLNRILVLEQKIRKAKQAR